MATLTLPPSNNAAGQAATQQSLAEKPANDAADPGGMESEWVLLDKSDIVPADLAAAAAGHHRLNFSPLPMIPICIYEQRDGPARPGTGPCEARACLARVPPGRASTGHRSWPPAQAWHVGRLPCRAGPDKHGPWHAAAGEGKERPPCELKRGRRRRRASSEGGCRCRRVSSGGGRRRAASSRGSRATARDRARPLSPCRELRRKWWMVTAIPQLAVVQMVLGGVVYTAVPFYKRARKVEGETLANVETAVEVVEHVAEVTEKMAANAADSVPENGSLHKVAVEIEYIAEVVDTDAHKVETIINKIEEVSNKIDTAVEPVIEELEKDFKPNTKSSTGTDAQK